MLACSSVIARGLHSTAPKTEAAELDYSLSFFQVSIFKISAVAGVGRVSVAELVTSKLMPQRFSDRRTYKGVDKSRAHPLYFPLLTKLDLEIRVIRGVNFFGDWQKSGALPRTRI